MWCKQRREICLCNGACHLLTLLHHKDIPWLAHLSNEEEEKVKQNCLINLQLEAELYNETQLGSADSPADLWMDRQIQLIPAESSQPISRCMRDTFLLYATDFVSIFFPQYILETIYLSLFFSKLNTVNGLNKNFQAARSNFPNIWCRIDLALQVILLPSTESDFVQHINLGVYEINYYVLNNGLHD